MTISIKTDVLDQLIILSQMVTQCKTVEFEKAVAKVIEQSYAPPIKWAEELDK